MTGERIVVRIVLGDLPALPKERGTLLIVSNTYGGEHFRLIKRLADNGAIADWAVERFHA
jgi:hypothetical protein